MSIDEEDKSRWSSVNECDVWTKEICEDEEEECRWRKWVWGDLWI